MSPAQNPAGCTGKHRYPNGTLAHRVLQKLYRKARDGVAYRCKGCGGWHIGGRSGLGEDALQIRVHGRHAKAGRRSPETAPVHARP